MISSISINYPNHPKRAMSRCTSPGGSRCLIFFGYIDHRCTAPPLLFRGQASRHACMQINSSGAASTGQCPPKGRSPPLYPRWPLSILGIKKISRAAGGQSRAEQSRQQSPGSDPIHIHACVCVVQFNRIMPNNLGSWIRSTRKVQFR